MDEGLGGKDMFRVLFSPHWPHLFLKDHQKLGLLTFPIPTSYILHASKTAFQRVESLPQCEITVYSPINFAAASLANKV